MLTHSHTHIHTYIHTYMHTCIRACICMCCVYVHFKMYVHIHIYEYIHAFADKYTSYAVKETSFTAYLLHIYTPCWVCTCVFVVRPCVFFTYTDVKSCFLRLVCKYVSIPYEYIYTFAYTYISYALNEPWFTAYPLHTYTPCWACTYVFLVRPCVFFCICGFKIVFLAINV